jgi:TolB-like protein
VISYAALKQRKIFQWAAAYLAGAWLFLQLLSLVAQPFAWPVLVMKAATILAAIGFFAVLVLAWYHGEQGRQRASGIELLMLAGILLVAAAAVAFIARGRPPAAAAPAGGIAEKGSIAVLPFINMSSDKEQEYFSDGLTEELLNVLAHIPALRVAARTSSFSFKGKEVAVDSIGRALGVAHVLEGSVRKSGDRVRITAQLIDARNGFHVWSNTYDRNLADILAVQDEISKAIAGELQIKLAADDTAASPSNGTSNTVAHDLYLLGLDRWSRRTAALLGEAVDYFSRAIAADADYADAHAGLALALSVLPQYNQTIDSRDALARGRTAAQRALELDPSNAAAYAALSQIAEYSGDFAEAEREARRAIELNPNYATGYQWLAESLQQLGRREDALKAADNAVKLDPLSGVVALVRANTLNALGRYDDAIAEYERGIGLNPALLHIRANLFVMEIGLKRYDRARAVMRSTMGMAGLQVALADTLVDRLSDPARRADLIRDLHGQRYRGVLNPLLTVPLYEAVGVRDSAVAVANRISATAVTATDMRWVLFSPVLSGLASDPRLIPAIRIR